MSLEYGKIAFMNNKGNMFLIQPKSLTKATKKEEAEIHKKVFEGGYQLVKVAMPTSTFEIE